MIMGNYAIVPFVSENPTYNDLISQGLLYANEMNNMNGHNYMLRKFSTAIIKVGYVGSYCYAFSNVATALFYGNDGVGVGRVFDDSVSSSYQALYYTNYHDVTQKAPNIHTYTSLIEMYNDVNDGIWDDTTSYPINYTANNCTLSAPSTASPGQDVVININPATGYSFRGASGVSIVDSYGDNVPFIVNGNQIAFTMPQP